MKQGVGVRNSICDMTAFELAGKAVCFVSPFDSAKGMHFSVGAVCVVEGASGKNMKLLDLRTIPCPECGQFRVVRRVPREVLSLADNPPHLAPFREVPPSAFPIARKDTAGALAGRSCHVRESCYNGAGQGISPSTLCRIVSAHCGVTVRVDKCPVCGLNAQISRISRSNILLVGSWEGFSF